ncbi:MAG: flavodoxin-dependent (E)-4-hydroxy-3-methylbut-2-enyl-diphosphate synthase [Erysipelotrichaceae bacterium]|jgi:(E)-4-hydroxy-3-methylbut-2-enyl-diphosphate synthase|nr:flavodoxin-dependent (E)-4-hydroxy-3-methylbut-2-enyl-diphosphate synthase [Erysipelotrichaceae bacterium]
MTRNETKQINVGHISIGHSSKVLIQTMGNIKTSKVKQVIKQINACAALGCDLFRVAILDASDAKAIKSIKKAINIPLIADIHFDYNLAILAIENGVDALRINPANIKKEALLKIINAAKAHQIPLRIGINAGSFNKRITNKVALMVATAKEYIAFFEAQGFTDLVLSVKSSDVIDTYQAYLALSKTTHYPLHLGITESSFGKRGLIRSAAGLAPLLINGLGDTIRISLTDDPLDEVKTAKMLLHDLHLYDDYFTLISCPACGRTMVKIASLVRKVEKYLEQHPKRITVAIMGCVVNGPGEGKNADLGLAGGKDAFVLFKNGNVYKTVSPEDAYQELIAEIERF